MPLSFEANQQVRIAIDLHARNVERMGMERAKAQVAIGFTWLKGHSVEDAPDAAQLLNKVGGSVSYQCANGQRNYVEIRDGHFITEVRNA